MRLERTALESFAAVAAALEVDLDGNSPWHPGTHCIDLTALASSDMALVAVPVVYESSAMVDHSATAAADAYSD